MGWQFHRSINLGPFRVNLSKSGVGYSYGAFGFRRGTTAGGRKYQSVGIPGTGVSYKTSGAQAAKGCMPMLLLPTGLMLLAAAVGRVKGIL